MMNHVVQWLAHRCAACKERSTAPRFSLLFAQPQTRSSCTLAEAEEFVEDIAKEGRHTFRRIALRLNDGTICPLTESAYVAVAWPHARVVGRLNTWLRAARG
jgi:hypothetical protein